MEVINRQAIFRLPYQAGFSLAEMIVVITISAILMTFAASRWSGGVNVNAQAQQLAADIRYTQSLAMTHGQRYRLTLTPPDNYTIATLTGAAVPDTVTRGNSITLSSGIIFGTITGLPNNIIAFNGRGTPYIDANAITPLNTTAIINLTWGGNDTRQIQINPNGTVIVQ